MPWHRLRDAMLLAVVAAVCIGFGVAIARTRTAHTPECTGAQSLDANCFVSRYTALTTTAGAKVALDDLAAQSASNQFLIAACHQLTHVVGRTAGERYGKAAFAQGSDFCASGYYHGVTESVMTAIGRDDVVDRAATVCAEPREQQRYSYPHYNCVHGMGHGFMAVFGSDIFKSLAGCDALRDPWEQHHCYGGVFMENLTAFENPSRPFRDLRADAPLYPCTAVESRYKTECYLKQTAYALFVRNDDFGAVFKLCREDADADFRAACYQGLGGDAAIKTSKYVIGAAAQDLTLSTLCLQGPDQEARSECVVGAVTTIVRDLAGDDTQARTLCAALDDRQLATVCETTRTHAVRGFPSKGAHHH
jgi:hypothetical protein